MSSLNPSQPDRLMHDWQEQPAASPGVRAMHAGIAVVIGAALALLVAWDPFWRSVVPFADLLPESVRRMPWLWASGVTLTVAVAVPLALAARHIFAARYTLATVLLILPGAVSGLNVGRLDAFDLACAGLTMFWLASSLTEHRPMLTPRWLLAMLAILGTLAFASAINGRVSTILGMQSLLAKLLVVILATNIVTSADLFKLALRTFVVTAVISSLLALGSEVVFMFTGYTWTFDDLEEFHYKSTPFGEMFRATAFLPAPQALGHLAVLGLAVTLMMPLKLFTRLTLACILLAGAAVSFSTGVYLTTAAVVVLAPFFASPHRSIHHVVMMLGVGITAYLVGGVAWFMNDVLPRVSDAGLTDRVSYMQIGVEVLRDYPLLGIGFNNFSRALYIPIHNAWLQMAAETGVINGLLFFVLVMTLTIRMLLLAGQTQGHPMQPWAKGLALGLVAMNIHFQVEPLYTNVISWTFLALAASALVVRRHADRTW